MAKNKTTVPPSQPETAVVETPPAEPASEPKDSVYCVEIPRCLLGERFFAAASDQEALAKYKGLCGITRHREPAQVRVTDLDPKRVSDDGHLLGESGDAAE